MQSKLFLLLLLLSVALCQSTSKCSDKTIISSDYKLVYANNADVTKAYNDVASCISLETNENEVCCYIKVKFENELYDEKYTHKGCIPMKISYLYDDAEPDIDDYIEDLEENHDYKIGKDDDGDDLLIKYKKVEIDCNSRFLQIAGFALLLFLL